MRTLQELQVGEKYHDPTWTSLVYYKVMYVGKEMALVEDQDGKEWTIRNPLALKPYVDKNQKSLNI